MPQITLGNGCACNTLSVVALTVFFYHVETLARCEYILLALFKALPITKCTPLIYTHNFNLGNQFSLYTIMRRKPFSSPFYIIKMRLRLFYVNETSHFRSVLSLHIIS